jgi:hypothetical protein
MSLAAGLAGALAVVSAARAQPPIQIATTELGPAAGHEEMSARVGPGFFGFVAALGSINPAAGPVTGSPLGERKLAEDEGKGVDGGLRYLCPDRLYKGQTLQINEHVYAECSSGEVADVLPRENTQLLVFTKFGPEPPPPPPSGPPTPLPCGGSVYALSLNSVANNIRTSSGGAH